MAPVKNLALLTLFVDTNVIDHTSEESCRLRKLGKVGWIYLQKTDVLDTELMGAGEEDLGRLLTASRPYPEALGPFVLGHSRLDRAVLGDPEDEQRLRQVFSILFPGADMQSVRRNHTRDAMHVAGAARCGANGFVTRDEKLQGKRPEIAAAFNDFQIYSPAAAVARALELVNRRRLLHKLEPDRGPLPSWPPATMTQES